MQDHEATAMMKAQFMTLWDGLNTDPTCTVIVMGATNRPHDLDKAILRRMPATFLVPLPVKTLLFYLLKYLISSYSNFFTCHMLLRAFKVVFTIFNCQSKTQQHY